MFSMTIAGTDSVEVPTIRKADVCGLCKGISPQNTALYRTVPSFSDPEIPSDFRTNLYVVRFPGGYFVSLNS